MKSWGVLLIGLAIGLATGLVYAWIIAPVALSDTYPPFLREDFRTDWSRMTMLAYGVEGNWNRTQVRLQDISEEEVRRIAAETLDRAVADGQPIDRLQRLARLAAFYGVDSPAVGIYAGGSAVAPTPAASPTPTPSPSLTPSAIPATLTPQPTPTFLPASIVPTPELSTGFSIISQTLTCANPPQIAVSLATSRTFTIRRRTSVEYVASPGRVVWLIWEDGADRAVTGFKPEHGLGYADFTVEPGHVYKLYVDVPQGTPISTIQIEPCTPAEGAGWISRTLLIVEDKAD